MKRMFMKVSYGNIYHYFFSATPMVQYIKNIWKVPELRRSIFFVLAMLVLYRLISVVPLPGVDSEALNQLFSENQILGLVGIFAGGGLSRFSIVAMGVAPYISSSIIFQLLTMVFPSMEALSKEPGGQEKLNHYSRFVTVPLALLQSYGLIILFRQSGIQFALEMTGMEIFTSMMVMSAGTVFLMWIGELISERKIGNGISLLIFAGIIARLPQDVQRTALLFDKTQLISLGIFALIALITIVAVVFITQGQRNIPVSYARSVRGNTTAGGVKTYIPLRVNQAGVIPIIFAVSIILFPPMVAQFFLQAKFAFLVTTAQWVIQVFQDRVIYSVMYFLLVVAFTYFYTAVVFHPDQVAENLQKQGGFIPGIRPGKSTSEYLSYVTNRIILAGSLFLGVIAILPQLTSPLSTSNTLQLGGTSLLIVVSVAIETIKQIDAQMTMRDYEGL